MIDDSPEPGITVDAEIPPPRLIPADASWTLSCLAAILQATSIENAWSETVLMFRACGFRHVIYGHSPVPPGVVNKLIEDYLVLSTLPRDEMLEMVSRNHLTQSTTFTWALSNSGVVSWSASPAALGIDPELRLSPEALSFYERIGLDAGLTFGFADGRSRGVAVMALAAPPGVSQDEVDGWLDEAGESARVLATVAHLALSRHRWQRPDGSLTPRQREVLEWVGKGKTTADIACILGLTPATVEKHLRLARGVLRVETTAHALIKAIFLNQVYLPGASIDQG